MQEENLQKDRSRMKRAIRMASNSRLILAVLLSSLGLTQACAQTSPAVPAAHIETVQELPARLSPAQKLIAEDAKKAFVAGHFLEALPFYKALLKDLPGEPVISKFASEAALETGDPSFALNHLKPIAVSNSDDWQAASLLTRAYAESGDKESRDVGIAHMLDLHRRGVTPPSMQQYTLERTKAGEHVLIIRTSVEPWGVYKVYDLGQVFDDSGKVFLRATLESSDADQLAFVKQHPLEVSKGQRLFSLDAYQETGLNSSGQRTQTHYTFQFFVGEPAYEIVREWFVKIAMGKASPLSSRTNLTAP